MTLPIGPLGLPEVTVPIRAAAPAPSARTASFLQELARAFGQAPTGPATNAARGFGPRPDGSLMALIAAAAKQEGLPPALLAALVSVESGFNAGAVSHAGAKGLTQLMDGTARALGVTDPFDPWQNLVGGARFLHQMIGRYGGDVALGLAAYNAGPGAVDAYGGIPPYQETQAHVNRVLAAYRTFSAES